MGPHRSALMTVGMTSTLDRPEQAPACWDSLDSILRLDTASLRLNSEPTRPRIGADQLAAAGDHVGPVHLPDRTLTARVLP